MVVVQVAQEDVADIHRPGARLDQPMMGPGPVVHDDAVVADLDEIAGARTLEGGRGRAGAEQGDLHLGDVLPWRLIRGGSAPGMGPVGLPDCR